MAMKVMSENEYKLFDD